METVGSFTYDSFSFVVKVKVL